VKQFLERSENKQAMVTVVDIEMIGETILMTLGQPATCVNMIIHNNIYIRSYPQWSCRTNRIYSSLGIPLVCARRVSIRRTDARPPRVSPATWSSARCCDASTASTHNPSCRVRERRSATHADA